MVLKHVRDRYLILFLLLLAIPACLYLILPGFYEPHDLHHLADIYEMARAISSGQMPPRLGPDFTFGYGYPLFNFYYLLPFYLGAFFYFLIGSLTISFKAVFLVSIITSVVGMYLLLRRFVSKIPAITGALLFVYTPYRAVQIYVRGAMGEALALSLLPLTIWALIKVVDKPSVKNVIFASIVSFLFIISHNYFWVLSLPVSLIFIGANLWVSRERLKAIKHLVLTGIFSLGLSFYWWFPAIYEQRLVSSKTPFPLIDHFPFIKQLILPSWGYGSSHWGPGDEISFQIGVVNLLVVAIYVLLLVFKRKSLIKEKLLLLSSLLLIGFLASIFFMNIRSYPLWKALPFYDFIQFPWRLLFLTTFLTASLSAFVLQVLKRIEIPLSVLVIAASLVLTFNYFKPSKVVYEPDSYYLDRFFNSQGYSEDYLQLPNWVEERPTGGFQDKVELSNGRVLEKEKFSSLIVWRARVEAYSDTRGSVSAYYFPGWFVEIDGRRIQSAPQGAYGRIGFDVPKGLHEIKIYWAETNLRRFADFVSLGSLIILISLFIVKTRNQHE